MNMERYTTDRKLYKGKSTLTLENVYGELYIDYDIQKFEPTDKYYIREYYIESSDDGSSYQMKYNDFMVTDVEEMIDKN